MSSRESRYLGEDFEFAQNGSECEKLSRNDDVTITTAPREIILSDLNK